MSDLNKPVTVDEATPLAEVREPHRAAARLQYRVCTLMAEATTSASRVNKMLGTLTLEDAAQQAAGNWRKFDSFVWWRQHEMDDADRWTIVYSSNRDSGLLDQSNAAVIEKALQPFTEGEDATVVPERHSHWLVGHVDGYSIHVFDADGNITEAFRTYFELLEQMEAYPVLNESDLSQREYDATLENIMDAAWRVKREFVLPDDWVSQVYSWLSDNNSTQIENRDDQGGYPSEESLRAAFEALGYEEEGE